MSDRWYGVRMVFEHPDLARGREHLYEERIVLMRADSETEAFGKAQREAEAYSADIGTAILDYAMAFEMFEPPADGREVFSLMRESRLEPARYVERFFDTGRERSS